MTGDVSQGPPVPPEPGGDPIPPGFAAPVPPSPYDPPVPPSPYDAPSPYGAPPSPYGPAPTYPPPPGYAPSPYGGYQARSTDGFAITALVFGIIGGIIPAVVFGFVSLSRIKRSHGQKSGRGMAIAGLVLSAVWVVVLVLVGIAAVVGAADRDPVSGAVVDGGRIPAEDLGAGDCIADPMNEGDVRTVQVVPCDEPHHGEAFAEFPLPPGDYPGKDVVISEAEEGCNNRIPDGIDDDLAQQLDLYYLFPKKSNWVLGDHTVVCVASSSVTLTERIAPLR